MRFIPRWNNGYWKIFDTMLYKDVGWMHLYTDACIECDFLNQ